MSRQIDRHASESSLSRREILAAMFSAAMLLRQANATVPQTQPLSTRFPFYAMDTGLCGPDVKTLEDKVRLLHDLGYWGIDYTYNPEELPRLLGLLDRFGVQLACIYLSPVLEEKIDPRLRESVAQMKDRPTRIELAIRSRTLKPSDPAGDRQAMDLLRQISDWAADTGPVVSIYPHTGLWTERVEDGVRLADACGRKNVGTNFNLVHWAWVKQNRPLEAVLRSAQPHLLAVSINGLSGRAIVPLDQGDYDLTDFVRLLTELGYRGPIGVQGYGIPGPSRETLERSIIKWRQMLASLESPAH